MIPYAIHTEISPMIPMCSHSQFFALASTTDRDGASRSAQPPTPGLCATAIRAHGTALLAGALVTPTTETAPPPQPQTGRDWWVQQDLSSEQREAGGAGKPSVTAALACRTGPVGNRLCPPALSWDLSMFLWLNFTQSREAN